MLSPDTLVFFGNSIGAAGWWLFLALSAGIVIHLTTLHSFRVLQATSGNPVNGIQQSLGRRKAAILLICGKLPFAVCASAGLVVSAGFVFNEVFAYWFPNFAFAFLLLAAILLLNLFGRKTALVTQIVAIAVACIGLPILTTDGLFNISGAGSANEMGADFDFRYLAAAVIVLIGFDMGLYAGGDDRDNFLQPFRAVAMALISGGVLLALWGLATMAVVPAAKLESSTIPHMIMARKALGQTGRMIMGMVVICGVIAAVNALMLSISAMMRQLTRQMAHHLTHRPTSGDCGSRKDAYASKTRVATIVFAAGASALLMAAGFAGEPVLETWIRSSLVLWLAYYVAVNLLAFRVGRDAGSLSGLGQAPSAKALKVLSIAGTALAAAGLVLLEPEPLDMLVFIVATVAAVTVIVSGVDFYVGRVNQRIPEDQKVSISP
jgi:hypothetical protein